MFVAQYTVGMTCSLTLIDSKGFSFRASVRHNYPVWNIQQTPNYRVTALLNPYARVWLPLLQENRVRKGTEMQGRAAGSAQERRNCWCDGVDGNHCFWERHPLLPQQPPPLTAGSILLGSSNNSWDFLGLWCQKRQHLADSPADSVLAVSYFARCYSWTWSAALTAPLPKDLANHGALPRTS